MVVPRMFVSRGTDSTRQYGKNYSIHLIVLAILLSLPIVPISGLESGDMDDSERCFKCVKVFLQKRVHGKPIWKQVS